MKIRVITSKPLEKTSIKKIENFLIGKHDGKNLDISYELDTSVIGGILIVDGEDYYDGTLRKQIINIQLPTKTELLNEKKIKSNSKMTQKPNSISLDKEDDLLEIKQDILDRLDKHFEQFESSRIGVVSYSGDGIAKIHGLRDCKYGELIDIDGKYKAIALSLEEDEVGAIMLDDVDKLQIGMLATLTGEIVEVPVGEELLGRVVNPLGKTIDGGKEIKAKKRRPIEFPAPGINDRSKVNQPLQTGLLTIDSMIPIGKGQRELIIGDRQTGKTSIAIDVILNQKGKDVICVYVAIGQKASIISSIVQTLKDYGAIDYTCVVCSTASDSAPLQYIAPMAGCSIAEYFMYSGKDVLIVYDDLSKHAVAYRAMSLLLKRPPGREAYPGDIFYLHSRLLERAAKLKKELGGGSLTALPIIETLAGDISSYVPTNVISITDGQIFLESELFNAGVRPAINAGLSVSRVGQSAQIKPMRKISGRLRLELSQYRELEIFAQFGSDLDSSTKAMLERGEKTTIMLEQDVHCPMSIEHQILVLYITTKEMINDIDSKQLLDFRKKFLEFVDLNYKDVQREIIEKNDITMEISQVIEEAVKKFKKVYFDDLNAKQL